MFEFWYYYDVFTTRVMTGGITVYIAYRLIHWVF